MKYNDSFPEIFANLKDGDMLGFFKGGLLYSLIPRATGGDCNHVGNCYNVKRDNDVLSFNFFQQSFKGATFDIVKIYKTADGYIADDPYFVKQDVIYYRSLKEPLTKIQIALGICDAESQIGKKYGYAQLFLGLKIWDKILPRFAKDWLYRASKNLREVCSNNIYVHYRKLGLPVPKDFFSTPIECLNFTFFKGN